MSTENHQGIIRSKHAKLQQILLFRQACSLTGHSRCKGSLEGLNIVRWLSHSKARVFRLNGDGYRADRFG